MDNFKFQLFRETDKPNSTRNKQQCFLKLSVLVLIVDCVSGLQQAAGFSPTAVLQRTAEIAREQVDMLTSYISTTLTQEQGARWLNLTSMFLHYGLCFSHFKLSNLAKILINSLSPTEITNFICSMDYFRDLAWSVGRSHEGHPGRSARVHWQEGFIFGLHVRHACWRPRWGKNII